MNLAYPHMIRQLRPGAVELALIFAYSFGVLAYLQFAGPAIPGYDGYYHIRMAQLMGERGWVLDFPWLPYTVLGPDRYTDHHWLLHVIQAPFVWLSGDLVSAAKWSAVWIAALSATVFGWLLLRHQVRWPALWVLLWFAASEPFLYRLSMPRGQALALVFQLLAFHFLITRQAAALAALAAVFVLAYNGFAILAPLVLIGIVAHYVHQRRLAWGLAVAGAVGVALGLLIHPYFPNDVYFLWDHIVPKLFSDKYVTNVGSEWYPYKTWSWFTGSLVAVLAFLAGLFFLRPAQLKREPAVLYWFLAAGMFFVLYLKSRRFAEYFPPAAVLFLAFVLRERLAGFRWTQLRRPWPLAGAALAAGLVAWGLVHNVDGVRRDIRGRPPPDAYRGAARYVAAHSRPGELLLHSDWDDFPALFFHNIHNVYLVGLDPDFLRLRDAALFDEWVRFTRGRHKEPAAFARRLQTRWVFSDRKHKRLLRQLRKDPDFERVYRDDHAVVYRLVTDSNRRSATASSQ